MSTLDVDLRSALRAQVGQESGASRPPLAFANALLGHLDQNRRLHLALLGDSTGGAETLP